jgi:hypothetical protein
MARGLKHHETVRRTSITLPESTERRIHELMLVLRLSRSEVIVYLIDREFDRRLPEITRNRAARLDKMDIDSL